MRFGVLKSILVISGALMLMACDRSSPECGQDVQHEVISQDSGLKATTLLVDCGATTSSATWVLLAPVADPLDPEGQKVAVFESDTISVAFDGADLVISYGAAEQFLALETAHGIQIKYAP